MQSVNIVAVLDRLQPSLRQRQCLATLGIQAVILLSRGDRNHHVVAVVAAGKKDAHERLILRRALRKCIHRAELCKCTQSARRGDRCLHEIASGLNQHFCNPPVPFFFD
jgi:hypothetical protein